MKKFILENFPSHDSYSIYVDVFGGGGTILFAKDFVSIEIYNDIHGGMTNLFRVVRDHCEELQEKLRLTPYSREEYYSCFDYDQEQDMIEKARKFYVMCRQGYRSKERGGWGIDIGPNKSKARTFINSIEMLPQICERLREVYIENRDFREIFKFYDTPKTFFYCDPPYYKDARSCSTKVYKYEFCEKDHEDLLNILLKIKGKWLLSGYPSPLYDTRLSSFPSKRKKINIASQNKETKDKTTEVIWRNYEE